MAHKHKQRFIAFFLAVSLLLPAAGYAAETEEEIGCAYDDSSLLVKLWHSEVSVFAAPRPLEGCVQMEYLFRADGTSGQTYGLRKSRSVSCEGDWYVVRLEEGLTPLEARELLKEDPRVMATMLNYTLTTFDDPTPAAENDSQQWHLKESGIPQARELLESLGISPGGSEEVVVAVIDSGVDYKHPDLRDNIWTNPNETPDNGKDDDGNGYIDDIRGWNFGDKVMSGKLVLVDGNNDPMDTLGHGTQCAGIIAAADNGSEVTGVAYNVKIMPVKAIGSTSYVSNLIQGIEYACENGADVVSMSIGFTIESPDALTPYTNADVSAFADVVEKYKDKVVFVASAGNNEEKIEGKNVHGWPNEQVNGLSGYCATYPAALDGVIGVMAYGEEAAGSSDWLSNFSRWDPNPGSGLEYEIIAPGDKIHTTMLSSGAVYKTNSGTSFSTPFVAGLVALLLSTYKGSAQGTPDQILNRLLKTADIRQGYTYGIPSTTVYYPSVNIFRALSTEEDLDGDGEVTESDWRLLCDASHSMRGTDGFVPAADYNGDSVINVKDQARFLRCFQINQRANE